MPTHAFADGPYCGFVELAVALGLDDMAGCDEVSRLVNAGLIPWEVAPGDRSATPVRLIRRAAANRYLRKVGRKPLLEVKS